MKNRVIIRRVGAAIFDIIVSIIPILPLIPRLEELQLHFSVVFLIDLFIVGCIIPIITKGKTVGDSIFRIKLVTIEGKEVSRTKIFLRSVCYILFLAGISSELDDKLSVTYLGVSFIAGYIVILTNKNKYSENLTALDFLYKTKFVIDNQ